MASSTCMHINMGFDHDFSKKKITYQSHNQTINICTCCGFSDTKLSVKDDHFHTWNVYLGKNNHNFILKCGHFACKERIEFNPNTEDDTARYTYQNKRKYECLHKTFLETIYESD
jgi:hypothetical protein